MKYKRILTTVLLIVFSLAVIAGLVVQNFQYLKSSIWQYEINDFEKYQHSFELVADKLWELYAKEKKENNIEHMFMQGWSGASWRLTCYTNEGEYHVIIPISEGLENATQMISKALSTCSEGAWGLSKVDVTENQVNFHTEVYYEIICAKSVRPTTSFDVKNKTCYITRINRTFNPLDAHFNETNKIWYQCTVY